jgi:hypothetical protein
VRLAAPTPNSEAARRQRHERLRRDRAAAEAISSVYPKIETLGLALHFEGTDSRVPADQVHEMHPPARAFFEFPCPYADCDGEYNLTEAVRTALATSRKSSTGVLECSGARVKDHTGRQQCKLHLHYTITPHYSRA